MGFELKNISFCLISTSFIPKYTECQNVQALSLSIFFWFKTDYFKFKYYSDDVSMSKDYFCHKFECLGMPGNSLALFW